MNKLFFQMSYDLTFRKDCEKGDCYLYEIKKKFDYCFLIVYLCGK